MAKYAVTLIKILNGSIIGLIWAVCIISIGTLGMATS
jgi:hypothetical protein